MGAAILVAFSLSLFVSAALLFAVQPMVTQMVLPLLGGAPAVWNTAVVFFQTMLLGGYLYAYLVARLPRLGLQAAVHVGLGLCAFAVLPVAVDDGWAPPADGSPVLYLLGLLAAAVGLPLFVVSANAPLMQRWFSLSGHRHAADPYFLYSVSNLGSLAALAGYVALVAPAIGLRTQGWLWSLGFVLLVLLVGGSAALARRGATVPRQAAPTAHAALLGDVDWPRRLRWLLLSFAPASLMLGVTQHISTDVAAAPFLWVLPLSLYLLTFIVAFARYQVLRHAWVVEAQAVMLAVLALYIRDDRLWLVFALHLSAFLVTALACHGELARQRPAPSQLTAFYLWISLGGLLGGAFSGLLAPLLFNGIYEYQAALILACLLRPPGAARGRDDRVLDVALPLVLAVVLFGLCMADLFAPHALGNPSRGPYVVALLAALYWFRKRPVRFTLGIAAILLVPALVPGDSQVLWRERSFFGVYRVQADPAAEWHELYHGTTTHGIQLVAGPSRLAPLSYYGAEGPLGQIFAAANRDGRLREIAAIGLGVGTIACYRQPGQTMRFYEIDDAVVRIARNPALFTYLADCADGVAIDVVDGRRGIAAAPDGRFDLIVLDAFSSDAIPTHLLTREALDLFRRKLAPRGIIAFHISNGYLDLAPVVAGLAADAGMAGLLQQHHPRPSDPLAPLIYDSDWVAVARTEADLALLAGTGAWVPLAVDPGGRLWTDDHADVLGALMWGFATDDAPVRRRPPDATPSTR